VEREAVLGIENMPCFLENLMACSEELSGEWTGRYDERVVTGGVKTGFTNNYWTIIVGHKSKLIDSLPVLWPKVEKAKFGSCDFGAVDVRHGLSKINDDMSKVCKECNVGGCGRDILGDRGSIGR
jgi:hypothetical protein